MSCPDGSPGYFHRLLHSALAALGLLAVGARGVALAQGLPTAPPSEIGLSSAALERISSALQAYVDSGKVAGVVAAVARHGKVGYAKAFGRMDAAREAPMRADAVFRIYPMTKPVIAAAVLRLVDQGKVRLDDPVSKYIPAFAGTKVYANGPAASPVVQPPSRPITIEHLLTHTSGLSYGYFGQTPVDSIYLRANLLDDTRTVAQMADSAAHLPLLFSPGDRWNYSVAIDVLGRVIEVASGVTLDRFLDRELFTPVGMRETSFHVQPHMDGRIPVAYSLDANRKLVPGASLLSPGFLPAGKFLSGGGGLLSTTADYLRFAQMLLNGGELDGRRVLSRESVASMTRNHLAPALVPIPPFILEQSGYGFGLGGAVLVDSTSTGAPGSPGIYRWWGIMGTFFWIDPKADLIGMVWTQLNTGRHHPMEIEFQRLVYAAVLR